MKWRDTRQGKLATDASEFSSKGNHAKALLLIEEALALSPKDPMVLVYQGRVLLALGRHDDAEQSLRAALGIDGNLPYAWNELGMLMQSRGAFEKAAFCYEQSAGISLSVEVLTMLANVQLAFDPEKAIETAERALSVDSEWTEAQAVRNAAKNEIRRRSEE